MIERHYPRLRASDRPANTSWTQQEEARRLRAAAVLCMPDVLRDWPSDSTLMKRGERSDVEERLSKHVVKVLKSLGLISPGTAWSDVDVARMVREARESIADGEKIDRMIDELAGLS
jgi:hypothetical protein